MSSTEKKNPRRRRYRIQHQGTEWIVEVDANGFTARRVGSRRKNALKSDWSAVLDGLSVKVPVDGREVGFTLRAAGLEIVELGGARRRSLSSYAKMADSCAGQLEMFGERNYGR